MPSMHTTNGHETTLYRRSWWRRFPLLLIGLTLVAGVLAYYQGARREWKVYYSHVEPGTGVRCRFRFPSTWKREDSPVEEEEQPSIWKDAASFTPPQSRIRDWVESHLFHRVMDPTGFVRPSIVFDTHRAKNLDRFIHIRKGYPEEILTDVDRRVSLQHLTIDACAATVVSSENHVSPAGYRATYLLVYDPKSGIVFEVSAFAQTRDFGRIDQDVQELIASFHVERGVVPTAPLRYSEANDHNLIDVTPIRSVDLTEAGKDAFRKAVSANDMQTVQQLLSQGMDVNAIDGDGWTVLMRLLQGYRSDRLPMLHLLLQKGARVNPHLHGKMTFWGGLYYGVEPGNVSPEQREILRELLPVGLNVKRDGGVLLEKAALCGDMPVLKWLVEHGVDIWRDGPTAIKAAADIEPSIAYRPTVDALQFLISHGAYRSNSADCRAAFIALAYNSKMEITKEFLARGADRHKNDLSEALVGACGGARGGPSTNWGDIHVVNLLLQHGADPDGPNHARGSPLLNALNLDGDGPAIVRVLLSKGAHVNLSDEIGVTPLMLAATGSNVEMVKLLLRHGAKPNARSKDGRTALSSTRIYDSNKSDEIRLLLTRFGATQ